MGNADVALATGGSHVESNAATNDALGVFLIGLPVSSMSGGDKEAAISVAKGQLQEIDRVQQVKGCS